MIFFNWGRIARSPRIWIPVLVIVGLKVYAWGPGTASPDDVADLEARAAAPICPVAAPVKGVSPVTRVSYTHHARRPR